MSATGASQPPGTASGTDNAGMTVPIGGSVSQFVVLFYHSKTLSFRGLYAVDPLTASLYRIYGRGPIELPQDRISGYLKYETGSRSFVRVPTKTLGQTVDAVSVEPSALKRR